MTNIPNPSFIKQEEPSLTAKPLQNVASPLPQSQELDLFRSQLALQQQQKLLQWNGLNSLNLQYPLNMVSPFEGKVPIDVNYLKNLFLQNETMKNQLNSLLSQRESLLRSIKFYEQQQPLQKKNSITLSAEQQEDAKKKRFRRSAKNISRLFMCPIVKCTKSYGSEGSLHQHIRLKHPEFDITTWIQSRLTEGTGELSKVNSNESKLTMDSLSAYSQKQLKQEAYDANNGDSSSSVNN